MNALFPEADIFRDEVLNLRSTLTVYMCGAVGNSTKMG